jgi:hypothetical protein
MKNTTRFLAGVLYACSTRWRNGLALLYTLRALRNDDFYYF